MKKLTGRLLAFMALAGLFVFSGCGDDDEFVPTQTIWEIVQERENLSTLETLLAANGLDDDLAASGEMTLFAPSDAALNTLLTTLGLQTVGFDPVANTIKQAVLTYHVANQQVLAAELAAGNTINTLQGESITVGAGPVLETGATADAGFDETNILATNGVVHIVDVVLVPPSLGALIVQTLGTVAQPLLLLEDFSILAAGIRKADEFATANGQPTLVSALISDDPLKTVFAPTNATFEAGSITVETFTGQQWYGIIANHVGLGDFAPSALTTGTTINTAAGGTLTITNAGSGGNFTSIFIDSDGDAAFEAEVAQPDLVTASNGRIHVIAGVLTP
ncbi:MAG: fasciclin domain-containing protein [Candidatus Cyclobacteriaceae bacterium M2_1C_046]